MSGIVFKDFLREYKKQNPVNISITELDLKYQKDFDIFSKRKIDDPLTEIYADFKNDDIVTSRKGAGVTIITPKQTVSSLLDSKQFFHEQTIMIIDNLIYQDNLYKKYRKQNIEIRYCFADDSLLIILEVPIPINSSQKDELEKVNLQIKEFKKRVGTDINVCYSLDPGRLKYRNIKPIINYNTDYDLDNLLNLVTVDDSFVPNCFDKYLIGNLHNKTKEIDYYTFDELKDLFCEYLISSIDYITEKLEDLDWMNYLGTGDIGKGASFICSVVEAVLLEAKKNSYLFEIETELDYYLKLLNDIKRQATNYIVGNKKFIK